MAGKEAKPRRGRTKAPPGVDAGAQDVSDSSGPSADESATGPQPPEPIIEDASAEEEQARAEHEPQDAAEPETTGGGSPETLDTKPGVVEPPSASRPGGLYRIAGAIGLVALLAAAAAGGWYYGRHGEPGAPVADARLGTIMERLDRIAGNIESQAGRLQATERATEQMAVAVSNLENAVAAARTAAESGLGDQRISELQAAIKELGQRVAETNQGAQLAELSERIGRIEQALSGLRTDVETEVQKADSASAIGNAYSALADSIAQGAPYAAELDRLASLVPNAPGLDVLREHAASGVATLAALDERLAQLALQQREVPQPFPAEPAQDGLWPAMRERLEGLVKVQKADELNWGPVVAQARQALKDGDLASAIASIEGAPEAPPGELQAWLAEARARRAVDEGRDRLSASVLRQLAGQG